jgi:hypothetical protein
LYIEYLKNRENKNEMTLSEQYKQAKDIPIVGFLARMRIKPKSANEETAWYNSPFRHDPEPSFKVNRKRNEWIDFGYPNPLGKKDKQGGDLLDLVKLLNPGITDQGALALILNLELPVENKFSFRGNSLNSNDEPRATITQIKPLTDYRLINYIIRRKITPSIAYKYCKEVHYQTYKPFFGIGFQNDLSDWHIRLAYQTKTFPGKIIIENGAVTTIPGNNQTVNIFEGLFNFLSALEYYHTTKPTGTVIVLNSVSNLHTIIDTLTDYQQINLFLDNDNTGNQAAETITSRYPKVKDYSKIIYKNYKDFNEFLTAGNPA